ncbi:MAG: four helix bundle protein [Deltaproteobacteria bacterium]
MLAGVQGGLRPCVLPKRALLAPQRAVRGWAWVRADVAALHPGPPLRASRLGAGARNGSGGGVVQLPAWVGRDGKVGSMTLRIYSVALEMCVDMRPIVRAIARQDRDLAKQLTRAACSVVLNLEEGAHSEAGHQRERFRSARGSAAEVRAAVDAAVAFGMVAPLEAGARGRLDMLIGALTKLAR